MDNKCCIVIPSYKDKLEGNEKISFDRCIEIFGNKRPINVVIPNNIKDDFYTTYNDTIDLIKVDEKNMESVDSYSRMLCSKEFWNLFTDYEYVLIYQTDCWVFEDKLDYFIEMGYDWYGAPWPFWNNQVGNGGFSLRKVSKMLEIVSTCLYDEKKYFKNEDTWFCKKNKDKINACPWEIAVNFSLETPSKKLLDTIDSIPMGLHGKRLTKLWDNDGSKFMEFKNKQNNVDIFICTHKDFEPIVTNEAYKIIDAKRINNDKAENGLDGSFYSELMSYKYIYDNVPLKKYIGFCCYRKYFNFLDDIPDLDEIFSEYDCITAKPLIYGISIKEQYDTYHNIEDLYIVGGIIADKYPTYAKMWHNFINGDLIVPYNMFIMKSEDFREYIKFMFDILDEYVNIVGTNINKRIYDNYEKYIKDFYPNDTVEYQYRIGGYLGERLTNLFLMTHFNKMITYKVIITENKYNEEKTNQD